MSTTNVDVITNESFTVTSSVEVLPVITIDEIPEFTTPLKNSNFDQVDYIVDSNDIETVFKKTSHPDDESEDLTYAPIKRDSVRNYFPGSASDFLCGGPQTPETKQAIEELQTSKFIEAMDEVSNQPTVDDVEEFIQDEEHVRNLEYEFNNCDLRSPCASPAKLTRQSGTSQVDLLLDENGDPIELPVEDLSQYHHSDDNTVPDNEGSELDDNLTVPFDSNLVIEDMGMVGYEDEFHPPHENDKDESLALAIQKSLNVEENIELDENGNLLESENGLLSSIKFHDAILGNLDLAQCDWGYKEGKILNPSIDRNSRRRMRKPLTEVSCPETLYSFVLSLLNTALELELEVPEDKEERFFAFDPYNKSAYGGGSCDDFSQRSYDRKIGIRTRLNKEAANVILTCYYILYNNFKQTTDEIIFEDVYREGVLMQDSNFDLAKFYERITTKDLGSFEPLRSLMAECLELKPFPDRLVQFNAWTLTYSQQTKEVTSSNPAKFAEYLTIFDLISKYDREWLTDVMYPKQKVIKAVEPVKVVESKKEEEVDVLAAISASIAEQCSSAIDTLGQVIDGAFPQSSIEESNNEDSEPLLKNDGVELTKFRDVDTLSPATSVPSTPVKKTSNSSGWNTVDNVINGFLSHFKRDKKKKN